MNKDIKRIMKFIQGPKGPFFGRLNGKPVLPARGFHPELGEWFQLGVEEKERIFVAYPLAPCERMQIPAEIPAGSIIPPGWKCWEDYAWDDDEYIIIPRRAMFELEAHWRAKGEEARRIREAARAEEARAEEEARRIREEARARAEELIKSGAVRDGRHIYDAAEWTAYQEAVVRYRAALERARKILEKKWKILSRPQVWTRVEIVDGFEFKASAKIVYDFDDNRDAYGGVKFVVTGTPPERPEPLLYWEEEDD